LRRVATLVARGVSPEDVFAAVTEEVGRLLPVSSAAMGRYDSDGMFTTVAAWSRGEAAFPVGRRWFPEGKNITTLVFETGRPALLDSFADASGSVGVTAREAGYRSAVGSPIIGSIQSAWAGTAIWPSSLNETFGHDLSGLILGCGALPRMRRRSDSGVRKVISCWCC